MLKMTSDSDVPRPLQQFSDLFVQRHSNVTPPLPDLSLDELQCYHFVLQVSILYADIVHFTQLSETLSPYQLVATLNQLFGKFDQIAQVDETSSRSKSRKCR